MHSHHDKTSHEGQCEGNVNLNTSTSGIGDIVHNYIQDLGVSEVPWASSALRITKGIEGTLNSIAYHQLDHSKSACVWVGVCVCVCACVRGCVWVCMCAGVCVCVRVGGLV